MDSDLLRNRISAASDDVSLAVRGDDEPAVLWVQNARHREQRLESVTLSATVWGDIGFTIRHADPEVCRTYEGRLRQARPIISNGNSAGVSRHMDVGDWGIRLFAGVQTIVHQLFDDDQRPLVNLVAGL